MKRLLSISKTTIALSLLWSVASWSLQLYLGIPFWVSILTNLSFCVAFCLKYPAIGAKNLNFRNDWQMIVATGLVSIPLLRWVCTKASMPKWGYYLALTLSIVILERAIIELKKLLDGSLS